MTGINGAMEIERSPVKRAVRRVVIIARGEVASFAEARKAGQFGSWVRAFLLRQYWAWAAVGSIVIGLTLPVLLVMWNAKGQLGDLLPGMGPVTVPRPATFLEVLGNTLGITVFAVGLCGPPAAVFAVGVYVYLRKYADDVGASLSALAQRGAIVAAGVAFVNVPGYLAIVFMPSEHPVPIVVRLGMLFIVAGVSCGMWIAWQAWRATRPTEPALPRYSLSWLLMLVIAWGAVMAVFAPK